MIFYDNVSHVRGNHTFKFGGSFFATDVSTANETFFGGRFNFGAAIPLSNLVPAATLPALRAFLTANNPGQLAALNTPINALQSFNLNLPIVYQQGFGTPRSTRGPTGMRSTDRTRGRSART